VSTRRLLLSTVAGVLTLTALLAIAILLFGSFGETEGRILGTTIFLALFGLISLPGAILLDQKRHRRLAALLFALSVAGFALATAGIWIGDPPEAFGKLTVTVIAFGLAAAQTGALAGRRRENDTGLLRLLSPAPPGSPSGLPPPARRQSGPRWTRSSSSAPSALP